MSKLYNNYSDIVNDFHNYFSNFSSSKTLLNFVHNLFCSLIHAESTTLSKIALSAFQFYSSPVKLDSITKRISRTLHNSNFSLHAIFDSIVSDVISRYKLSHSDNNVHISFDQCLLNINLLSLCLL